MPKNPKMGKIGFEKPENALKVPAVPQSGPSRTTKFGIILLHFLYFYLKQNPRSPTKMAIAPSFFGQSTNFSLQMKAMDNALMIHDHFWP